MTGQRARRSAASLRRRTTPVVEGQMRPRYRWARTIRLCCCRTGLHFLAWDGQCDAYTCACRRVLLGAEHIR